MTEHDPAQAQGVTCRRAAPVGRLTLPIGLGTNTFARITDADESYSILDSFATSGGVLVDTADTCSDGSSESILGAWMRTRGNRDQLVVSTKCGNHPPFDGLSAPAVHGAVEASLRRLGTDHIDVSQANGFTAPSVLQPHYSLVHRQPFEDELAPLATRAELAVLPYRALGGGFLSPSTGQRRTPVDDPGAPGCGP